MLNFKQLIGVIIISLASVSVNAQAANFYSIYPLDEFGEFSKKANEIAERKLIITVLEEDPTIVSKLAKSNDPEKLKNYKKTIKDFNEDIRLMADSLWTVHKSIKFMSWEDALDMKMSEKSAYAIITIVRYDQDYVNNETVLKTEYEFNYEKSTIGGSAYHNEMKSENTHFTVMRIGLLESIKMPNQIHIPMGHLVPNVTDIAFGLSYANWFINTKIKDVSDKIMFAEIANNSKQLADLTLLISETDAADEDVMGKSSKKAYPYKTSVVTLDVIKQHILDKTPGYAYLNFNHGKACAIKTEDASLLYVPKYNGALGITIGATVSKMGENVAEIIEKGVEE